MEIVKLANGRFSVVPDGAEVAAESDGEFDTQAEAEAWRFEQVQRAEGGDDPTVLHPGGGQGLR